MLTTKATIEDDRSAVVNDRRVCPYRALVKQTFALFLSGIQILTNSNRRIISGESFWEDKISDNNTFDSDKDDRKPLDVNTLTKG